MARRGEPSAETALGSAVTWLFVPGDRPERFAKAAAAGADAVILDLEDAVPPGHKDAARSHVLGWLGAGNRGWVRINGVGSSWYAADLVALAGAPGLAGFVVPKAEDPDALDELKSQLGHGAAPAAGVVALVESALGVHRALDLATCDAVDRLAFGSIDFAVDIGADGSWGSLLAARNALVLASRVAGIAAPVDGVTTALHDPDQLQADVATARSLGFTGKLCIHPSQLPTVRAGFAPSEQEVEWARRVLAAVGHLADEAGAVAVDGAMVDAPVLARARRILDSAARFHPVEAG